MTSSGRGETRKDFADAILAKGAHAHLPGALAQNTGGDTIVNEFAALIIDDKNFKDAEAAAIAGVIAIGTALAFLDVGIFHLIRGDAQGAQFAVGGDIRGGALFANFADEALSHEAAGGRGDQETV